VIQLMHSFHGHEAPPAVLDGVRRGEIGAFCLFNFNAPSPESLRRLTESLYAAARAGNCPPPLIGMDQEGGQLMAVTGGTTELPGNMALGATRSPELAELAGRVLARELLAMGVNLNFAPALDVNINPANPVIGTRSFGDRPELVAELGRALIRGTQAEGVIATAKHFPGHGDTADDSHHLTPTIHHSMGRMETVELAPFREAIAEGVQAVMTAHIRVATLDRELPATLSPAILSGLLRGEMGFQGLILTDAMDMYAVARFGARESVEAALEAGADLVLLAHLPDQLQLASEIRHLINPQSAARIRAAREKLPKQLPSPDVIGSPGHQAIAQRIADASITVVREGGQLPLRPKEGQRIAVITARPENLTPADTSYDVKIQLAEAVQKRWSNTLSLEVPMHTDVLADTVAAVGDADIVIVGTITADQDTSQAAMVRALCDLGKQPIVVSLRTPYDIIAFPMVNTYLCSYSIRPVSMEAVARVLFGEIQATGVLPCALPEEKAGLS
jgi:beta-N-acetylhexosaminidase